MIVRALGKGIKDLLLIKFLLYSLGLTALSLSFWGALFWFFYESIGIGLFGWTESFFGASSWIETFFFYLNLIVLAFLWLPLSFVSTLILLNLFLLPMVLKHIVTLHYPNLKTAQSISFANSLLNIVKTTLIYLLLWIPCLILSLLLPFIGGPLILLLNAWYLRKTLVWDILESHASKEQVAGLSRCGRRLSIILTLLTYVPFLNLIAPLLTLTSCCHYYLGRIEAQTSNH